MKLSAADIRPFSGQIDYFPHVDQKPLADGGYDKFNDLQAKDHTYFTSGLNSFELVEYTIRAARDLVETHFLSEIITMVKYCEFSEAGALFY